MELSQIALRAVVAYALLLVFTRIAGKRTVFQGSAFDLVVPLIAGDMVDDRLWGDVGAAEFVAGLAPLFILHMALAWCRVVRVERLMDIQTPLPPLGAAREM
jgi:uncharacterized membrane protein YcaP (DUF421 family)